MGLGEGADVLLERARVEGRGPEQRATLLGPRLDAETLELGLAPLLHLWERSKQDACWVRAASIATYLLTYSLTYLPTYVHTYLYLLTSERYMKSV